MGSLWLVPAEGEPIRVDKPAAVVGRDPGSDVVVRHQSVSRRHALFERSEQGWTVADQKSGNGTWIDGQRVIKAFLRTGQSIRFGAVEFTVSLEKPAPRGRAAVAPPPVPSGAPGSPRQTTAQAVPPPLPKAPSSPPGPPTSPAPSPGRAGTMSAAEAAEILGVAPGAPAHEIRSRYQKIYNDFQIRLTNAPTPSLKRMYQKNLQDLKAAAEVLSPGIVGSGS